MYILIHLVYVCTMYYIIDIYKYLRYYIGIYQQIIEFYIRSS